MGNSAAASWRICSLVEKCSGKLNWLRFLGRITRIMYQTAPHFLVHILIVGRKWSKLFYYLMVLGQWNRDNNISRQYCSADECSNNLIFLQTPTPQDRLPQDNQKHSSGAQSPLPSTDTAHPPSDQMESPGTQPSLPPIDTAQETHSAVKVGSYSS